jgi:hypothetical protein
MGNCALTDFTCMATARAPVTADLRQSFEGALKQFGLQLSSERTSTSTHAVVSGAIVNIDYESRPASCEMSMSIDSSTLPSKERRVNLTHSLSLEAGDRAGDGMLTRKGIERIAAACLRATAAEIAQRISRY